MFQRDSNLALGRLGKLQVELELTDEQITDLWSRLLGLTKNHSVLALSELT